MVDGKIVILRLDSNYQREGFQVSMEMGPENRRPNVELRGHLSARNKLYPFLDEWRKNYHNLSGATRLTKKLAIYDSSSDQFNSLFQTSSITRSDVLRSAKELELEFRQWLESADFREIDTQLREEVGLQDNVQVVIQSDDPRVFHLPWHTWSFIERYRHSEIIFAPSTYKRKRDKNVPKDRSSSIRILAVFGGDDGIDISEDRECLNRLKSWKDVEIYFLNKPSRQEFNDKLWDSSWDILFFAGHSEIEGGNGIIKLNDRESLSLKDLRNSLHRAIESGLQLAIFNSCEGLGLAHDLKDLNIPQMIIMREPVPDEIAQKFLRYFLEEFSKDLPLHKAVRSARERLQVLEKDFPCATWLPTIFQVPGEVALTWSELQDRYKSENQQPESLRGSNQKTFRLNPCENVEVVELISAEREGRVKWNGTTWSAKLYDSTDSNHSFTLRKGDAALAVARVGNSLLVIPNDVSAHRDDQSTPTSNVSQIDHSTKISTYQRKLNSKFLFYRHIYWAVCSTLIGAILFSLPPSNSSREKAINIALASFTFGFAGAIASCSFHSKDYLQ